MKNKILKSSFIFIVVSIALILSFSLILKDKGVSYFDFDEYYEYVTMDFLEVKDDKIYIAINNNSKYYLKNEDLNLMIFNKLEKDYKKLNLEFSKENNEKGEYDYIKAKDSLIYVVKLPEEIISLNDLKENYSLRAEITSYLYMIEAKENLYGMIFMSSVTEPIDIE